MNFRDKEKAMQEIMTAAENEAKFWSSAMTNQPLNSVLAQIIGAAVAAGISKAIEVQYTQDDFEKDLDLKS